MKRKGTLQRDQRPEERTEKKKDTKTRAGDKTKKREREKRKRQREDRKQRRRQETIRGTNQEKERKEGKIQTHLGIRNTVQLRAHRSATFLKKVPQRPHRRRYVPRPPPAIIAIITPVRHSRRHIHPATQSRETRQVKMHR